MMILENIIHEGGCSIKRQLVRFEEPGHNCPATKYFMMKEKER
jgi:hypothetical protein